MPRWTRSGMQMREGDKVLWYGLLYRIITLPQQGHIAFTSEAIGIGVFHQAFKFDFDADCWKIRTGYEPHLIRFITLVHNHPLIAPMAETELIEQ